MARASIALLIAATMAAAVTGSAAHAADRAPLDETAIVEAVLLANGVESAAERAAAARYVQGEIDRVVAEVGAGRPGWRRAARLHERLHREYLRSYVAESDGLVALVESGTYNCVSATLFYGLVAHRLGYGVRVLEYPGHLLLRLRMHGRRVDVETTDPDGFDLARFPGWKPPAAATADAGTGEPFGGPLPGVTFWEVDLTQAVGFAWLNRAWRLHGAGRHRDAAEAGREAASHLPGGGASEEMVVRLLSQSFRDAYEAGDFDTALAVAEIDVRLLPGRTTSRDRLFAAGLKCVEVASEHGRIADANAVLRRVRQVAGRRPDTERFERLTTPLIAVAAVREGAWLAAESAAARFAEVEPDRIESDRLTSWIEGRRRSAGFAGPGAVTDRYDTPLLGLGSRPDSAARGDATR